MEFAKQMGFSFLGADHDFLLLESHERQRFELLRLIEFTSDRKRMSVLVRDPADGLIKLYVKGADSIILDRLGEQNDPQSLSLIN